MKKQLSHFGLTKITVALCLVFTAVFPFTATAQEVVYCPDGEYMTPEQRALMNSGVGYYDLCALERPETTAPGGGTPTTGPLVGCDGAEQAYNFFKAQGGGLSDQDIAGILGNLSVESGFNPQASNNGNYLGIAQWDTGAAGNRWGRLVDWVQANPGQDNNTDPYNLGNQLRFLWFEANQRGNIQGMAQQSGSTNGRQEYEYSAWYWGRYFEVAIIGGSSSETPFTNVQALDERIGAAGTAVNNISTGEWCTD